MGSQPVDAPGRLLARKAPRLGFLIPSLFAAAPTLALMAAMNVRAELDPVQLFAILYLAALPATVAGLHVIHTLSVQAARLCGGRMDKVVSLLGVLPLGFLLPQYQLISLVSRCSDAKDKVRPGFLPLDILVNVLTFGAVIILYGMILERSFSFLAGEIRVEE